jgi:hypothetical protein
MHLVSRWTLGAAIDASIGKPQHAANQPFVSPCLDRVPLAINDQIHEQRPERYLIVAFYIVEVLDTAV